LNPLKVNPKTLPTRLKEMEKNGLIHRKIYHETPVRIEYNLTQKGRNLKAILDQMGYVFIAVVFKDGKPRPYKEIAKVTSS
jgi:DNA-binding HxlR family transcriptional regulator